MLRQYRRYGFNLLLGINFFTLIYFWLKHTKDEYIPETTVKVTKRGVLSVTGRSDSEQYKHRLQPKFPLPGAFQSPTPGFVFGNASSNASVVIGITSIQREKGDYLLETLASLRNNLGEERENVLIVVYLGETDREFVTQTTEDVHEKLPDLFETRNLQIISPPRNYYPKDWNSVLTSNFGDGIERVKWRSKQNLDQIFLMMYIYNLSPLPKYYLMMEDDVISSPGYMSKIFQNAEQHEDKEWFFLSYSDLGAIGKLFRTSTLPSYASFLHLFWNKKPIDWLQNDFLKCAYCSQEESSAVCKEKNKRLMIPYRPSLFQHIGNAGKRWEKWTFGEGASSKN